MGRFVGADPEPESAESLSNYQYGMNNPLMFNDPLGNKPIPPNPDDQLMAIVRGMENSAGYVDGVYVGIGGGGGGGDNSLSAWESQQMDPGYQAYRDALGDGDAAAIVARNFAGQGTGGLATGTAAQIYSALNASGSDGSNATISANSGGTTLQWNTGNALSDEGTLTRSVFIANKEEFQLPDTHVDPRSFKLGKINDGYYVNILGIDEAYYDNRGNKYQFKISVLGIQIPSRTRTGKFLSIDAAKLGLASAYDFATYRVVNMMDVGLIKSGSDARNQFLGIFNNMILLYFGGQSQAVTRKIPGANYSEIIYKPNPY